MPAPSDAARRLNKPAQATVTRATAPARRQQGAPDKFVFFPNPQAATPLFRDQPPALNAPLVDAAIARKRPPRKTMDRSARWSVSRRAVELRERLRDFSFALLVSRVQSALTRSAESVRRSIARRPWLGLALARFGRTAAVMSAAIAAIWVGVIVAPKLRPGTPAASPGARSGEDAAVAQARVDTARGEPKVDVPQTRVNAQSTKRANLERARPTTKAAAPRAKPKGDVPQTPVKAEATEPTKLERAGSTAKVDAPRAKPKVEAPRARQQSEPPKAPASAVSRDRAPVATSGQRTPQPIVKQGAETRNVGALFVTSEPEGADVSINGVLHGKTPLTIEGLAAGSSVVRVELAGYERWSWSVTVTANSRTPVNAKLQPTTRRAGAQH